MARGDKFDAGSAPAAFIGEGGRPWIRTATGVIAPLIDDEAAHPDPSFEGDLSDWNPAFQDGGTVSLVTDDVVADAQALLVETAAGADKHQHMLSGAWDVLPGDTWRLALWLKRLTGLPNTQIGMLSRASGDPTFIDGPSTYQQFGGVSALPDDYSLFSEQFTVPGGHFRAAMYFRLTPDAAEATSSLVDLTTSKRIGGGSVGFVDQVAQSAPVTPIGTEGGTGLTLTDLEYEIDCPNESAVYTVEIHADVVFSGAQTNIIELLVDGSVASGPQLVNSPDRPNGCKKWVVTGLPVGSHTFSARTRNNEAGSAATVNPTHTTMTVTWVA